MTRVNSTDKVHLSAGNWIAIAGITLSVMVTLFALHRTMVEIEVNQTTLIKQVERNTAAIDRVRDRGN